MKSEIHKKLQERVRNYYREKGYVAVIEHCVKGKKIDVLAQHIKSKRTIANEIQLSSKHFLENIMLDFKIGCDEVKIITTDKRVLNQIKERASKKLDKSLLKRTKFQLIEEFVPHLSYRNNRKQ
jgi:hypothetical protein